MATVMNGVCGIRLWGALPRFHCSAGSPLIRFSRCPFRRRPRPQGLFTTACAAASSPTVSPTAEVKKSKKNAEKEKVIIISGPTGAGKSRLALELAKRLNGEIISADSVQVYRGLDVGSAKPSLSDREEVPHYLIDILHPSEDYSVGQFFEDARQATRDILNSGRVPIVTGGTGLYLRWFVYGKPDVPKASPEIASAAHAELVNLEMIGDWSTAVQLLVNAGDSKAQHLPANDWYRLRRSLEIIKSTGSPPSAFQVPYDSFRRQLNSSATGQSNSDNFCAPDNEEIISKELDYEFLCFFLSGQRLDLYRSIDGRCEDMIIGNDGILSEARWLLDLGLLPNSNSATRAIGYRQAMEFLSNCREQSSMGSSREFYAFLATFQKASRNFAKRQMTWFRNELMYHWLDASRPMDAVLNFIQDAYNDQTETVVVPQALRMEKDVSNRRQISELKTYRTRNRYFIRPEDCSDILEWIRRTQG